MGEFGPVFHPDKETFGGDEKKQAELREARKEQFRVEDTSVPLKAKIVKLGTEEARSLEAEPLDPLRPDEKARMLELQKLQIVSMDWNTEVEGVELSNLQKRFKSAGEVMQQQKAA